MGDDSLLGTALGIWKAFANGNSIVLDVAAGAIVSTLSPNKTLLLTSFEARPI